MITALMMLACVAVVLHDSADALVSSGCSYPQLSQLATHQLTLFLNLSGAFEQGFHQSLSFESHPALHVSAVLRRGFWVPCHQAP